MRPLLAFAVAALAVVAALAAFAWWLDPLGQFWDDGVLRRAEPQSCLISDDLVGTGSWLPFKEAVYRSREPRVVVVGTSRVLELRAARRDFANLGMPGTGIETLAPLFRRLHDLNATPLTVYLGVELFWLNRTWQPNVAFGYSARSNLRYLLARQTLSSSIRLARESPSALLHASELERARGRCIVDRGDRVLDGKKDAWRVDGSFVYRYELGGPHTVDDEYTRDLVDFAGPYYRTWHGLDRARVENLHEALALARSYGWRVIGYTPPYSRRYADRIEQVFPRQWASFARTVNRAFRSHGYRWLDLRRVEDVPCSDDAFVDDGWHPDAACSAAIGARLAREAGE